jgi:type I restriction enzyme, R subunit
MVHINITRIDFQYRFQQLIDEYNAGSINQEIFFEELTKFSYELDEDRRKIVTGLTEEEMALFDKIKKPNLSENDKKQIKNVAKLILDKLQSGKLVIDWRKKQQARASLN